MISTTAWDRHCARITDPSASFACVSEAAGLRCSCAHSPAVHMPSGSMPPTPRLLRGHVLELFVVDRLIQFHIENLRRSSRPPGSARTRPSHHECHFHAANVPVVVKIRLN